MRNDAAAGGRSAVAVLAGVMALLAAGCGSSSSSATGATATHHAMPSHSATASASAASATFGPDCGMVPASGMGSFHGMSMDPVVTAAAHNPLLTTFAADVKTAGLTGDLNTMHAFTVFAPANSAFSKIPDAQMAMMHTPAELARILKYHVVSGRVTPAELASGMTFTTLAGGTLKGAKMGAVYEVNNADVICGNIQTANATVYVISKVLIPAH
ncbi:MAG TPA: fasciclin domain-containing protein [Streptosporangiaceae bacterium]